MQVQIETPAAREGGEKTVPRSVTILERQEKALLELVKKDGRNLSWHIRDAIDRYLAGQPE